jgi:prepilin-type N-terminal cleavage/methylation domain-containing protein
MFNNHKKLKVLSAGAGFTLIELLVVVLIIGILAAIALPQYQLAVKKSSSAKMLFLLKSLGEAQRFYLLQNGSYAYTFEALDITIPKNSASCGTNTEWTDCKIIDGWQIGMLNSYGGWIRAEKSNHPALRYSYGYIDGQKGLGCWAAIDSSGDKICKLLGGRLTATGSGANFYALQ